jgi:dephospho-CoA kinase
MPLIIISGLIGSGKSTLSEFFKTKGYYYLNSDKIAKSLIKNDEKIKSKFFKLFGTSVFIGKRISIEKLRNKLIESKSNKTKIEKILHPVFFKKINQYLKNNKTKKIIIEIPLIETCGNIKYPYKVITVNSFLKVRVKRFMKKSGESKTSFMKLNNLQKDKKYYINNSDYVLNNNDSMGIFKVKFNKLYRVLYNE